MFLGPWHGVWEEQEDDWVRFFHPDGSLVPTKDEAEREQKEAQRQRAEAAERRAEAAQSEAEAERRRADAEGRRADLAEAELARLRASLGERDGG